jgi:hypothetical protein
MKTEKQQFSPIAASFYAELRAVLDEVPRLVVVDPYDPNPYRDKADLTALGKKIAPFVTQFRWAMVIVRADHPEDN